MQSLYEKSVRKSGFQKGISCLDEKILRCFLRDEGVIGPWWMSEPSIAENLGKIRESMLCIVSVPGLLRELYG